MDKAEYEAIYKCRLCGEEFCDNAAVEENLAEAISMSLVVNGHTQHVKCQRNLYRHAVHYCKDGSVGFADFQGFRRL